jgi:hypothetical protein
MKQKIMKTIICFLLAGVCAVISAAQPAAQPTPPPDARERKSVIDEIAKLVKENYIFLETAQRMESHIRDRLQSGAYDKIGSAQEFATLLHEDLRSVSKDKHLGLHYDPEGAQD